MHAAFFEVKVEAKGVLDKGVGASNVAIPDLLGDSLLKFLTESDVHWGRVFLLNLSI